MSDLAPEAGPGRSTLATDPTGVRWAVHLPTFADPQTLVALAVAAELRGWDGCFFWDHIVGSLEEPMPVADTWVVLGAVASATERIRIGTAVTPVARRKPQELARQAVSVDQLSGGRLTLGVGLGTPVEAEYGPFGEPTDARELASRLDEGLAVLAGLWTGEPFSHRGEHFTVERATFVPGPVQQPRIPVWAACTWPHRKPLERAARWDGAVLVKDRGGMVQRVTPDEIAEARAEIRRIRGDDRPFDLAVVATDPRDAGGYAEAGATWVLLTGWLDTLASLIEAGPR
jgi:alkanesulfonate monooxygenase SsuD/methylene tetrahydromethanopterin reductase-like flavin-dependent oxidoreductase (luciferase family)